jgi:hypothetical protein
MCLDNNRISNNSYTKFLGLIVDNALSWKLHIEQLINKLSTACYVIRSVKPCINTNAIITIYHSLFHAVMTYGIIFWGNSSHSTLVFRMQKKTIIIIMGCGNRESCRNLFEELNNLPFMSQCILSFLTFVSNNGEQYFANFEIHNINTRHTSYIYLWHILKFTKEEFTIQVLRFSVVCHKTSKPTSIIQEHLEKAAKNFVCTKSFYSLKEYYDNNNIKF